jgi:dTDP-4-dehydrorhamnose reductase
VTTVNPRVFVLGHRGMLGHVVARLFADRGYSVETSTDRYGGGTRDPLIEAARESGCGAVINCLGSTKRRAGDQAELYASNAIFPAQLVTRLRADQHLIHPSTDCVFEGTRGGYRIDEEPDAADAYGFSKRLGEVIAGRPNVTVLRVSIVGPDRPDGRSLLGWFFRQPAGSYVPGYTNHRWNGITTLEWATIALDALQRRHRGQRVAPILQPGTAPVTKYELLVAARDVYGRDAHIVPTAAPQSVDRTLVPTDMRDPIGAQLIRMRDWYGPLPC